MYVIIKGKNTWRGKSVSEMARNLQKDGFPPEVNNETLDKIKFMENKYGPGVFKKENRHGKV